MFSCKACEAKAPKVCGAIEGVERRSAAIAAAVLRYASRQKPLTADALKGMPLSAWVWIEILDPSAFKRFISAKAKSSYHKRYSDSSETFNCGHSGLGFFEYDYRDYGKTWVAFRHEPTDAERAAAKWEESC